MYIQSLLATSLTQNIFAYLICINETTFLWVILYFYLPFTNNKEVLSVSSYSLLFLFLFLAIPEIIPTPNLCSNHLDKVSWQLWPGSQQDLTCQTKYRTFAKFQQNLVKLPGMNLYHIKLQYQSKWGCNFINFPQNFPTESTVDSMGKSTLWPPKQRSKVI